MIDTTMRRTIRHRGALALALTFGLVAGADRASAQEGGAPPEPEPTPAPQEGEEEEQIPSVNPLRPPGGGGGPEHVEEIMDALREAGFRILTAK